MGGKKNPKHIKYDELRSLSLCFAFSYLADVAWLVLDPAVLVKTLSPLRSPERGFGLARRVCFVAEPGVHFIRFDAKKQ